MIAIFYAIEGEIGEPWEGFLLKEEIRGTKRQEQGTVLKRGIYNSQEIILVQTGMWEQVSGLGNVYAGQVAEFVLSKFPVTTLIIVATCGGLNKNFKAGNLVMCNPISSEGKQSIFPDFKLCSIAGNMLNERGLRFYMGESLTIPYFARFEEKKEIKKRCPEAIVVEMENYFIASVAISKDVPFLSLRVVIDAFEENSNEREIEECFKKAGNILRDEFLLPFLQEIKKQDL